MFFGRARQREKRGPREKRRERNEGRLYLTRRRSEEREEVSVDDNAAAASAPPLGRRASTVCGGARGERHWSQRFAKRPLLFGSEAVLPRSCVATQGASAACLNFERCTDSRDCDALFSDRAHKYDGIAPVHGAGRCEQSLVARTFCRRTGIEPRRKKTLTEQTEHIRLVHVERSRPWIGRLQIVRTRCASEMWLAPRKLAIGPSLSRSCYHLCTEALLEDSCISVAC